MKTIEKITKENFGIIDRCADAINKRNYENGDPKVFTSQAIGIWFTKWKKGKISLRSKEFLLPAINTVLGSDYTIYDLDKEICEKE